jgi:hypothetical protein
MPCEKVVLGVCGGQVRARVGARDISLFEEQRSGRRAYQLSDKVSIASEGTVASLGQTVNPSYIVNDDTFVYWVD